MKCMDEFLFRKGSLPRAGSLPPSLWHRERHDPTRFRRWQWQHLSSPPCRLLTPQSGSICCDPASEPAQELTVAALLLLLLLLLLLGLAVRTDGPRGLCTKSSCLPIAWLIFSFIELYLFLKWICAILTDFWSHIFGEISVARYHLRIASCQ
jgi:hypothetical protein